MTVSAPSSSRLRHMNRFKLFEKLLRLRQELERARMLLDLARKREVLKTERVAILHRATLIQVGQHWRPETARNAERALGAALQARSRDVALPGAPGSGVFGMTFEPAVMSPRFIAPAAVSAAPAAPAAHAPSVTSPARQ